MDRRGAFDYILLETSGLADPGNIVPLFWVDEGLGSTIYLDGVVVLVDAKNFIRSLDESPISVVVHGGKNKRVDRPEDERTSIACLQISHADVVVINKSDLVSTEILDAVKNRIRGYNGLATQIVTTHSRVPRLEGVVLDLHAYEDVGELEVNGHSHLDPVRFTARSVSHNVN